MEQLLKALETVVSESVMTTGQRREFRGLIAVGRQLEIDSARAEAAYRAKIDNAVLPECDGFVGAGTRCESCKIRKAMHD